MFAGMTKNSAGLCRWGTAFVWCWYFLETKRQHRLAVVTDGAVNSRGHQTVLLPLAGYTGGVRGQIGIIRPSSLTSTLYRTFCCHVVSLAGDDRYELILWPSPAGGQLEITDPFSLASDEDPRCLTALEVLQT